MKKRLLSLLLILCLCAALLPAAVSAEDNVIELNQTELDGLLGEATPVNPNLNAYSYENPLPAGSYRLAGDVVLRASIVIEGNVTLDLNGKSITRDLKYSCGAFRVIGKDASLTLMDSSEEQSGAIDSFGGGDAFRLGGGVYVEGGSFIMDGGTIYQSYAVTSGGGVYLTNAASFTMSGGAIQACEAKYHDGGGVYIGDGCTFIMEGGAIDSCKSSSRSAGGVYAAGTFIMSGGEIRSCHTEDGEPADGGGVFIAPNGRFEMSGGSIENCYTGSSGKGGGVYVGGTFTMTGGTIKNNVVNKNWGGEGAGVYVANGANATLIEANITDNKRTSFRDGRPVLNDSDAVTDNISSADGVEWKEYTSSIDPDYPLISILPALAKDFPFTDVTSTDWFYSDVKYAYETGLMTGTAADAFSPEAPVTRGMVMTILARREGIRTDRYTPWYAAGCEWAKANGISDGSNPEAPVTREQLAAMLYRYAALKGRDLTAGENLNFTDASDVSAYALPALQWATGEKILTGSNGALNPQATATRAHLAAILHRYFG